MIHETLGLLGGAVLVTGNRDKLIEARRVCGAELEAVELDLPEIQSLDVLEIVHSKAAEAYAAIKKPLIVEETGLELAALNGFPGPLIKWMLSAVGAEGIARTAESLADTRAIARCTLLYFDGERETIGEGTTAGTLVLPARGKGGFGWDPIFQPEGLDQTYAEMDPEQKDRISHRAGAWRHLTELLRTA